MSKVFEDFIDRLARQHEYGYDFLVDRYNEVMEEDADLDYFIAVTKEHDW